MGPKLLVVGSINADLTAYTQALPQAGQTVPGGYYAIATGGKGANCAAAAALLGGEVTFCGRVGADDHGRMVRQALVERGVADGHITTDSSLPTGFAVILLDASGQNRIIVYIGSNGALRLSDVQPALDGDYEALAMPLEISEEVLSGALATAHRRGIPTVIDAGPVRPGFDLALLRGCTVLSPNETECEALCGILPGDGSQCEQASAMLMERTQARYVVLKLGERGAYVYGQNTAVHVPAYRVEAVDTTAAGDAFTGALALEFARSADIVRATHCACAVGALCVTRKGAMAALPQSHEVESFIRQRS